MKRSEINQCIRDMERLVRENGFSLPPFCSWSPEEWNEKGHEYDEIRDLAVTTDADGEGFSVDFDVLMQENPDTIGWIRFDEPAVINYPVVKSADNEDYLTKTFTARGFAARFF